LWTHRCLQGEFLYGKVGLLARRATAAWLCQTEDAGARSGFAHRGGRRWPSSKDPVVTSLDVLMSKVPPESVEAERAILRVGLINTTKLRSYAAIAREQTSLRPAIQLVRQFRRRLFGSLILSSSPISSSKGLALLAHATSASMTEESLPRSSAAPNVISNRSSRIMRNRQGPGHGAQGGER
jgi:hypothetical protein